MTVQRICPKCETRTAERICPVDGYKTVEWAASENEKDPYLGEVFEEAYKITHVLGQGGFGAVYHAIQLGMGRPVAIKILLSVHGGNLSEIARFQQEARALAMLRHPGIVGVHDFGQAEDGALYLVMEYLEGETLDTKIKREGHLSMWDTADLAVQMCDALAEAHAAGIIHRDLKPANIFLTKGRRGKTHVKILDFGIARVSNEEEESPKLTRTGMVVGSPAYMSPEQCSGKQATFKSDLYSLGCILYQCLTGQQVFQEATPSAYLIAHATKKPSRPSLEGEALEGLLIEALMGLLEKDPNRRPRDADAALEWFTEAKIELRRKEGLSASVSSELAFSSEEANKAFFPSTGGGQTMVLEPEDPQELAAIGATSVLKVPPKSQLGAQKGGLGLGATAGEAGAAGGALGPKDIWDSGGGQELVEALGRQPDKSHDGDLSLGHALSLSDREEPTIMGDEPLLPDWRDEATIVKGDIKLGSAYRAKGGKALDKPVAELETVIHSYEADGELAKLISSYEASGSNEKKGPKEEQKEAAKEGPELSSHAFITSPSPLRQRSGLSRISLWVWVAAALMVISGAGAAFLFQTKGPVAPMTVEEGPENEASSERGSQGEPHEGQKDGTLRLVIESSPMAMVFVNERPRGMTPYALSWRSDEDTPDVLLRAEGYEDALLMIDREEASQAGAGGGRMSIVMVPTSP